MAYNLMQMYTLGFRGLFTHCTFASIVHLQHQHQHQPQLITVFLLFLHFLLILGESHVCLGCNARYGKNVMQFVWIHRACKMLIFIHLHKFCRIAFIPIANKPELCILLTPKIAFTAKQIELLTSDRLRCAANVS